MRPVFSIGIFFSDESSFFKILYRSADRFFRNAEVFGYALYTGPGLTLLVPAITQVDVDELRPLGKLVSFIQFFKIRHKFTSYADVLTFGSVYTSVTWSCSLKTVPPAPVKLPALPL